MTDFPAYAADFQLRPRSGTTFSHLSPLFRGLRRVDFTLQVVDPHVNEGQILKTIRAVPKDDQTMTADVSRRHSVVPFGHLSVVEG
jgi:hypothetical protein